MLDTRVLENSRHRTGWIETGPAGGPLLIFLHGWPELGIVWRAQLEAFAGRGWRCVAPDLRGYGRSSVPSRVADYAVRQIVGDMVELHDALGGQPAVWIGHDHGSMIAWAMAMHYPERCRGVASLCVPHFARGIGLPTLVPFVDRALYPADAYPVGQWDYMLFYLEHFARAVRDFEDHTDALLDFLYARPPVPAAGDRVSLASVRAAGGWFARSVAEPPTGDVEPLLSAADRRTLAEAFAATGFSGPCAWYLNDADNLAFAAEARDFGRLTLPALFVHAEHDQVCDTVHTALAAPMRDDCADLTERVVAAGHMVMLEAPDAVNAHLAEWLDAKIGARPGERA